MARATSSAKKFFDGRTLKFLRELSDNNSRDWFAANKTRYEAVVVEPALALIEAMAPGLRRLSEHYLAVPKRTGGSLMRIYRDVRFSKDKRPFKTNIGIQFRHERARDVHAPGFYLHVEPGSSFIGAGSWRPESSALAAIRAEILDRPATWRKLTGSRRFSSHFELAGDSLMRPPRGIDAGVDCIEDIKRKDFIAIAPIRSSDVTSADLPKLLNDRFRRASALVEFLCAALDLDY